MQLNSRARALTQSMVDDRDALRIAVDEVAGARVIDCGAKAPGGLEAGRRLAEVCLAGLGQVAIGFTEIAGRLGPTVTVRTDHPVAACMASQYAGWELKHEKFFAMGSGPMRAAAGREELFQSIGYIESAQEVVGVLETAATPPEEVIAAISQKCAVPAKEITLLYAPTNSQAGTLQVVARSVETALHKLHELGFELSRIESGMGIAPLPAVAGDLLSAIGRTNDAILYGAEVVLWVRGDDDTLRDIGPKTPSQASPDHGRPFKELFEAYEHDFYRIDKLLFSPAVVTFCNLDTGRTHRFGELAQDVLERGLTA